MILTGPMPSASALRPLTRALLAAALIALMLAAHQDYWLWRDPRLLLRVLPIGLAYHVGYSLCAALAMWALAQLVWPHHLEAEVADDADPRPPGGADAT